MGFNKISGYENEKKELLNLQKMLRNSEDYKKRGIRIPRGVVLYGEPGVGKTVMARAIAGKGINLVELRAADIDGRSELTLKDVFDKAVKKAPCVLLLDELDKLAGTSMEFYMEGNDFVNKALLQELDKLTKKNDVLVVATCNDLHSLGEALLRPGRFDRIIKIDLPNENARTLILKQYFEAIKMEKDFKYEYVAKITNGKSCAALECLANESAIYAAEKGRNVIKESDVVTTLNKQAFAGVEQDYISDPEEARKVAIHEAGHVLVAMALTPENVFSASIIPQGNSRGHVYCGNCMSHLSVKDVEDNIAISLAGAAAEKYALNERYVGSSSDICDATMNARELVVFEGAYGYGCSVLVHRLTEDVASEKAREFMCDTIKQILETQEERARKIIENNMMVFYKIADRLSKKHVLSRDELFDICKGKTLAA